jgi:hypothetical protein
MLIEYAEPLTKWRLPFFLRNWSKSYLLPWLSSTNPSQRKRRDVQSDNGSGSGVQNGDALVVSEEDIMMLESMGFQRAAIIEALQLNQNDIHRAVAFLLG